MTQLPCGPATGRSDKTRHAHLALRLPRAPQSVGKTSIITRFVYDKFDAQYQVRVLGPPQLRRPAAKEGPCLNAEATPRVAPGTRRPLA